MDGADVFHAEPAFQEGGHGAETATVAGVDDDKENDQGKDDAALGGFDAEGQATGQEGGEKNELVDAVAVAQVVADG